MRRTTFYVRSRSSRASMWNMEITANKSFVVVATVASAFRSPLPCVTQSPHSDGTETRSTEREKKTQYIKWRSRRDELSTAGMCLFYKWFVSWEFFSIRCALAYIVFQRSLVCAREAHFFSAFALMAFKWQIFYRRLSFEHIYFAFSSSEKKRNNIKPAWNRNAAHHHSHTNTYRNDTKRMKFVRNGKLNRTRITINKWLGVCSTSIP